MADLLSPQVLGVVAALLITLAVFEALRRGIVAERFAALWITVSVLLLLLAIFPGLGTWIAGMLGVKIPANLLFFAAAVLLLLVSVQFSYEIGKLDSRTRRLAEEVALLQREVDDLQARNDPTARPPDEAQ